MRIPFRKDSPKLNQFVLFKLLMTRITKGPSSKGKILKKLFVLFATVAFATICTEPAMAAEWSFYGKARIYTSYQTLSKKASGTGFDDSNLIGPDLQKNSIFGATAKSGAIGGGFEYGIGIHLRKLYGTWNFDRSTLLVGRTNVPVNLFYSNQIYGGDAMLRPYGAIYGGRRPMIQISIEGFKFAAIEPRAPNDTAFAGTDTSIPKLEAKYTANLGPVILDIIGGYNKYDLITDADSNVGISSYIVGGSVRSSFGPVYINAGYYFGQNLRAYGLWQAGDDATGLVQDTAGNWTVEDTSSQGLLAVLGFKLSDMISFELGYGTNKHENDLWSNDDKTQAYYVNTTLTIAKSSVFFIVPELGVIDFMDNNSGHPEGTITYFGLKWQINF